MSTIIKTFQLLEKEAGEEYRPTRIVLNIFPSNSCALDVVLNEVLTVFEYSERLKQFGIYSGSKTEELYNAETEVFELNEFEEAKDFFFERLDSVNL
jgi:hypothetical protein